ncbi:MAG: aldo/keto reductase [Treponema sp.]|jgi:predicted aldo/keto reductase-like oxidoreductase|nr:aldo/keto reductase [Treponema sp.]
MQYRIDKKSGAKLSVLGLGCMRFPRNPALIDMKKTERIIMTAVENGVNYFDTAWMYPGSEEALGTVLERNGVRDNVFIASKLPIALVKKAEDFDRFFNEELSRLKTDRIDYYLMHMLTDAASWKHLAALGIEDWIAGKKKNGSIGRTGFSFHGIGEEFFKILEMYPWEFCQIQYNYSDENFQAGVKGLKKAAETMPVIIMEPLLGGKLAGGLPRKAADIFKAANLSAGIPADRLGSRPAGFSPAGWGLRWVWNQAEAAVVLSGMNDPAQVLENAALADITLPGSLGAAELDVYRQVREVFNASYRIHCTGCGYCMPCPRNVNIPGCFAAYNTSFSMGRVAGWQQYMTSAAFTSAQSFGPANCVACGNCERRCPQKIPIVENLKTLRRRMEPLPFRIAVAGMRKFLGRKP